MSFPRASVLFLSDHYRSQKLINFKKLKKIQTIYGDNSDPEITRLQKQLDQLTLVTNQRI
jgi:hypothetical protein